MKPYNRSNGRPAKYDTFVSPDCMTLTVKYDTFTGSSFPFILTKKLRLFPAVLFWDFAKLYIQSTLMIDFIFWHTQLIVTAVKR